MKKELREILHKYEQTVDAGDFVIDGILSTSYEDLIVELIEFLKEAKDAR